MLCIHRSIHTPTTPVHSRPETTRVRPRGRPSTYTAYCIPSSRDETTGRTTTSHRKKRKSKGGNVMAATMHRLRREDCALKPRSLTLPFKKVLWMGSDDNGEQPGIM